MENKKQRHKIHVFFWMFWRNKRNPWIHRCSWEFMWIHGCSWVFMCCFCIFPMLSIFWILFLPKKLLALFLLTPGFKHIFVLGKEKNECRRKNYGMQTHSESTRNQFGHMNVLKNKCQKLLVTWPLHCAFFETR